MGFYRKEEMSADAAEVKSDAAEEQKLGVPPVKVWLEKGLTSGSKDYLWWCVNQIEQGKLDNIYETDDEDEGDEIELKDESKKDGSEEKKDGSEEKKKDGSEEKKVRPRRRQPRLKYPDDVQQQLVSHLIRGIHQCVEWQNEEELEEEEKEPAADKLVAYVDRWKKQETTWVNEWRKKQEAKRKLREEKRRAKLIAEGKDPDKFPPKEQRLQRKVVEKVDH